MGRHAYIPASGARAAGTLKSPGRSMERTGVEALSEREARALSGGEWQRVLIARALAQEAGVLLLDEPVANLDIRYQLEILRLLRALAAEGRAVVLVMHDIDLAARFCDRLAVLRKGRLYADGSPADVLTPALAFRCLRRLRRGAARPPTRILCRINRSFACLSAQKGYNVRQTSAMTEKAASAASQESAPKAARRAARG